jgi:Thiol:disulfide interchange protein DsbD, N-terminal
MPAHLKRRPRTSDSDGASHQKKMKRTFVFRWTGRLAALALVVLPAAAQSADVLSVVEPPKLIVRRGEPAPLVLKVNLKPGYHVNSNTPSEDYLIPLRLSWDGKILRTEKVSYPAPKLEKYSFAEKPLSVFTGDFEIDTQFRALPKAPLGPGLVVGSLRYQACNNRMCLPPKTVAVRMTVLVK